MKGGWVIFKGPIDRAEEALNNMEGPFGLIKSYFVKHESVVDGGHVVLIIKKGDPSEDSPPSYTIDEPAGLNLVSEFHKLFKHPILEDPQIPSEQRCKLRVVLLSEEVGEFEEAIKAKDIVAAADALCDIQYVLSGAILEFGLADRFKDLFEEVQRSNMSKACLTQIEAIETINAYEKETGKDCHYEYSDGNYLVFRNEDKKTIKSINYSPTDLQKFFSKMGIRV